MHPAHRSRIRWCCKTGYVAADGPHRCPYRQRVLRACESSWSSEVPLCDCCHEQVVVRSATVLHRCAAPSINVGAAVGCAVASVIILASIILMAYSRSRSRKSDEDLSNTGNQAVQQEADATKRRKTCRLCRKIWLVCRGIVMTTLTAAALTVIVVGILGGFTSFTGNNVADFVLFIADVSLLGMMEGLQIALLQVSAADCKALKYACPAVWQCYELTKGPLMDDWLCGRQLLTIFCVYVSARLTTFIGVDFWYVSGRMLCQHGVRSLANPSGVRVPRPFTTTPVPDWFQTAILDTGLPGALVTVCIGQLVPQIIASPHPVQFLKLPGCVPVIKLAKLLYSVGLTHLAKGLVHLFSKAACLRKHALVVTESAGTEQVDAVNAAQDSGDVKHAGDGEPSNKTVAVGGDPDCGKPHPVKAHSTRSKRIADAAPTVELEGGEDLVVAAPVSSGDDDDDDDSTGSPSGRQESSTGEALLPRTPVWTVCDSCRFAVMVVVSLCALAFLCGAIWLNYSNFAGPGWSHLLILACMICILAYLEGLQVALIQGSKIRPHSRLNGIALRNFRRTQDPVALMRFMSGRQVFVILTVYLITQITTFPTLVTLPFFDDVVLPSWFLDGILSPGIPAVLLVASLGQLLPQLLATQFPSFVLQACASNVVIWCALALDACGFTVVAWMVSESTVFYARLPATPTLQRTYIDHSKLQVIHYVYDLLDSEDGDCVETADLEVGLQEQLVEGCDEGLEMVPISDTTDLAANASSNNGSNRNSRTASLDSDHHGAGDFDPLESSGYPTPTQLAIQVLEASDSNTVPRFLLPPGHDKHVPPHVVAFQLMQQQDINGSGQLHMEGTGGEPSQADDIA